jgi:hypothetical protein
MSLLQCIVFLARCRNAYYAALHNVWVKFVLDLIQLFFKPIFPLISKLDI